MPRRKSKVEFTLFPFLSVLSGLIAVNVLLLIVVIGTRVIDPGAETPLPEAGEGGEAADSKAIPDGIDAATFEQVERQVRALEAELEKRKAHRSELRLQLKEIASLIAAKELELERSQVAASPRLGTRIGEPTPKKIIPRDDGRGNLKNPVFIEVNSTGYILHPEKKSFPVEPAKPGAKIEVPAGLKSELAAMAKQSKDRYPLLLIHPNGAETWRALVEHIGNTHKDLDLGWEPFSREWLLDSGSK